MEKVQFSDFEVDRCVECGGLWLDLMEKEKLLDINGAESIDIGDPEKGHAHDALKRVNCPRCDTPMIRLVDIGQPHIWYESCQVCFGVYFDAGEFKDLAEHSLKDFFKGLRARK